MNQPPFEPAGRRRICLALAILTIIGIATPLAETPHRLRRPPEAAPGGRSTPDGAPVEVHIAGIRMVGPEQALLLLADKPERRAVPIAVGRDQGIAIYLGKEKTPTPRPMTHDLMAQILDTLQITVDRVVITELRDNTYYSEISLRSGRKHHLVDARPSDAIALAVRMEIPIFASPELLTPLDEDENHLLPRVAEDGRALGLSVQALESDLAEHMGAAGIAGVLVASVAADSPAGRAGLRRGDILRRIDSRPTADLDAYRDAVREARSGSSFDIWRDGEQLTLVRP